jgi:hypothetical protein
VPDSRHCFDHVGDLVLIGAPRPDLVVDYDTLFPDRVLVVDLAEHVVDLAAKVRNIQFGPVCRLPAHPAATPRQHASQTVAADPVLAVQLAGDLERGRRSRKFRPMVDL